MDDGEIEGVVGELAELVGTPFAQVWQPARDRVVLGLGDGTLVLMVPRGVHARLHTVDARPRNPQRPFSFQGACRARLRGPLTAVEKVPGERVVRVAFGAARLELRLTGRSGGLWLVEGDTVVAAFDGPAPDALPPLPARGAARGAQRFAPGPGGTWNLAARAYHEAREGEILRAERRARLEVRLERALQRAARLVENLEGDLAKADRAPAVRHEADLLAANLHRARRGQTELVVEDWEGGEVRLALDPAKPATATLDRLYHQARRLERVGERVLARLETVEAERREHAAVLARLHELTDEALDRLDRTLPQAAGRPRPTPATLPYVTWGGPRGERVLVGRNEAGNRRLVFQTAKGHDWWMHLRGRPGAHLVIPVPKGSSPPLELLLAAAQIALAQAHVEPGEASEVQYTRIRDVRAIPGEVGRVTVANEKVLRVVRDAAGLVGWAVESDD